VHHYNGAQCYEQFLQDSRLDWALILLGVSSLSSECLCIFGLRGVIYYLNIVTFTLLFSELTLVVLTLYLLTIAFHCCDAVGWIL